MTFEERRGCSFVRRSATLRIERPVVARKEPLHPAQSHLSSSTCLALTDNSMRTQRSRTDTELGMPTSGLTSSTDLRSDREVTCGNMPDHPLRQARPSGLAGRGDPTKGWLTDAVSGPWSADNPTRRTVCPPGHCLGTREASPA